MATLRDLTIRIRPVVERGGFRIVKQDIAGIGTATAKATRNATAFGTALGNVAARAAAAGMRVLRSALRGITTGFAQSQDELAKFSKATGQSIESLQGFRFAGGLTGVAVGDLNKGLLLVAKRARDASIGLKAPADAFRELGVEVKDASGNLKSQDVLLLDIADKFRTLPSGTQKSALAMEIFGKSGAKLIPLLNEGSVGINRMRKEAEQLGGILGDDTAKKAEDFNDSMLRLRTVMRAVQARIASALLPVLTRLSERFLDVIKTGDNLEKFLSGAEKAIKGFAVALGALSAIKLTATIASFAGLAPALLIVGGIVLGVNELVKLVRGENNLISKALGDEKTIGGLREAFATVVEAVKKAAAVILPALSQIVAALAPIIATIAVTLAGVFADLAPVIASIVTQLAPVITTVLTLISGVLQDLQPLIAIFLESVSEIVKELLPVLQELFAAIAPIIKDLVKSLGPLLKILIKLFGGAVLIGIRQFAFAMKLLKPIISILSRALKELGPSGAQAFGLLGKAINVVGKAISPLGKVFEGVARFIKKVSDAVKEFVDSAKKIPLVGRILNFALSESEGGTRGRGRLVGGGGAATAVQGLRSAPIPGVTAPAGRGATSTTTQTTNVGGVTVNVRSQASPAEIGRVVRNEVSAIRRRAMEDVTPSSQ